MKLLTGLHLLLAVWAFTAVCSVGCRKRPDVPSQAWSRPIKIAESWDGIIGSASIYRHNSNIIALVPERERWAKCLLFNSGDVAGGSWTAVRSDDVPNDYHLGFAAIDHGNGQLSMQHGIMEENRLTMRYLIVSMVDGAGLRIIAEKKWTVNQSELLGMTEVNVKLAEPGRRDSPLLGRAILDGAEIWIPYCLAAKTVSGNTVSRSHFNNGVFHSVDGGGTWQMERISDFDAGGASICRSPNAYYYFALRYPGPELWFSRRRVGIASWDRPQVMAKTFAKSHGNYDVIAADDVIHLCWLDSRHEKSRLNLQDPYRRNYEVAYCRRRDSDAVWSKEVILSRGFVYSYAPSMSVEGDRIVVAWAGFKAASDWHSEDDPNDIYYVVSNDAGRTWSKPLMATDRAKDGITSGKPQLVLLNGVIHLIYVQGKLNLKQEFSGLTKLNQPPWPIYYQQHPFPD